MFNEELLKSVMSLFNDFFLERASSTSSKKCNGRALRPQGDSGTHILTRMSFSPMPWICTKKMIAFYISLGLAAKAKYDQVFEEYEKLHYGNTFLRETITQLQSKMFAEGGEKVPEAWKSIIDKQLKMNKEIAKNFFELFKQLKSSAL
jgi:hypothetical protein